MAEEGGTVISGGATGIDTAAHMGALDKEGCTVAVLANPVESGLHPYEAQRSWLQAAILEKGGLVSEYQDHIDDFGQRALQRDRVITGLVDAFVAVECGHDSATVDTAKRAYIRGRKVFAVQWDFVSEQWRKPDVSGNAQLFREVIAQPIPSCPTRTLKEIGEEFRQVLKS